MAKKKTKFDIVKLRNTDNLKVCSYCSVPLRTAILERFARKIYIRCRICGVIANVFNTEHGSTEIWEGVKECQ